MVFNNRLVGKCVSIKGQVFAVFLTVLSLLVVSLPSQALEVGGSAHQGTESETQGYTIFIADNFSRRSPFYWSLGLSRYDEVFVEWNNSNLKFPINSAEASLSYRHQFTARNPTMRRFTLEYQLGVAASLTDNKFTWAELNEEKYFSETGDINGFLAISAHYQVSSNVSAIMGVRYFPNMSEFGSMSSVFLGFKFSLDFGPTYYGN
ncbi:hypothetical protein [Paraglaciecola sp. MB-3u-78]|uniref:hypothetical protein n=1 Tax=Paraglaciecola sp. MB-3u-78 TaxID=2058332 RepID=UPI000C3434EF|nr:hypothetical protein [Paraglaciecola sp. MB-3u-78]PKG93257.1 hypothetical protein CXF95_27165 [Paraglaciecola sp. MB-3u-78]